MADAMTPEEAIEKAIEALNCGYSSWSKEQEVAFLKCNISAARSALARVPKHEAVEPVEWPTREGLWKDTERLNGVDFYFAYVREDEMMIADEKGNSYRQGFHRFGPVFVPCRIVTLPIKEPEPVPEKPPMLLGKWAGRYCWFVKTKKHEPHWVQFNHGVITSANHIEKINEAASDPEAIAIWKREKESDGAVG